MDKDIDKLQVYIIFWKILPVQDKERYLPPSQKLGAITGVIQIETVQRRGRIDVNAICFQ